ncbi:hypothetical protein CLOM621_06575 [Clostridium sp. M62/1]|nr:hypothetical protein CLOM621_06575 [Clostridium sp. M62/1]
MPCLHEPAFDEQSPYPAGAGRAPAEIRILSCSPFTLDYTPFKGVTT